MVYVMRQVLVSVCMMCVCMSAGETSQGVTGQDVDENGYLIFCLCMGQFGNQVQHFLGGLAFAKQVNRTLVLPPWRTYKNLPFTDWFKYEPLLEYHRVITAEDFMRDIAPVIWPPEKRIGHCFAFDKDAKCEMKRGSPFGPFWDGLGIDFAKEESFTVSYSAPDRWTERFPPFDYPVIALKGAPAKYPMSPQHYKLHQYLQWSDNIREQAVNYIDQHFPGQAYVGIHLRNGPDWVKACENGVGREQFMASPQCRHQGQITQQMCLPNPQQIVKSLHSVLETIEARVIYVATDKLSYITEIKDGLREFKVAVYHQDPWLPQIDLYILGQAEHFIGNCVSSFTSFVTRERSMQNKPTTFWGV